MHRNLRQPAALEERDPVGVLERIAAGAADQVGAQQNEDLIDGHRLGHIARQGGGNVHPQHQDVGAKGGADSQAQHRIKVERRQQQPPRDQRQLRGCRLQRHQHRADAEQRRRDLHGRLIPASVEAFRGHHENDEHERQLQPETHHVGLRQTRADQHPMIDDGKTERGGQSDQHAHAHPAARAGAVTQQEFSFELGRETQAQPAASGDFCDCGRARHRRVSQPVVLEPSQGRGRNPKAKVSSAPQSPSAALCAAGAS